MPVCNTRPELLGLKVSIISGVYCTSALTAGSIRDYVYPSGYTRGEHLMFSGSVLLGSARQARGRRRGLFRERRAELPACCPDGRPGITES